MSREKEEGVLIECLVWCAAAASSKATRSVLEESDDEEEVPPAPAPGMLPYLGTALRSRW